MSTSEEGQESALSVEKEQQHEVPISQEQEQEAQPSQASVVASAPVHQAQYFMNSPRLSMGIELINSFGGIVEYFFGLKIISVSENQLVQQAEKAPNSPLFGDQKEFITGLRLLCSGIEKQPLTPAGNLFMRTLVGRLLTVRSSVMNYIIARPEIAQVEINEPIIVLGMPRTGSTLLYNLLAQDPKTRSPFLWEMYQAVDPVPPTTKQTFQTDPRIQQLVDRLKSVDKLMPGFLEEISKSHPLKPNQPDEELFILFHELVLSLHMIVGGEPYEDWVLDEHNKKYAYVYLLRYIQMLHSGYAPQTHWTLKAPWHAFYPQELLEAFPSARIVVTHREMSSVLPSLARLLETNVQYLYQDNKLDRRILGRQVVRMADLMVTRLQAYRDKSSNPKQFCDVSYSNLVANPIEVVKSIYSHYGLTVSEEHEQRMVKWMAENPQGKHGRATYEAADYGLDLDDIKQRFSQYTQKYHA